MLQSMDLDGTPDRILGLLRFPKKHPTANLAKDLQGQHSYTMIQFKHHAVEIQELYQVKGGLFGSREPRIMNHGSVKPKIALS